MKLLIVVSMLAGLLVTGCGGTRDAEQCDFYHSLGSGYSDSKGYIPSDIQDKIDEFC